MLLSRAALAAVDTNAFDPLGGQFTNLAQVFGLMTTVVIGVGIALTVVYLVLGGIKYVMSQGDPKATQTAREWLTNAVIGFIVVLGAFAVQRIVVGILGGNAVVNNITPTP